MVKRLKTIKPVDNQELELKGLLINQVWAVYVTVYTVQ